MLAPRHHLSFIHEHDVVIEKRSANAKKSAKKFRDEFGHTPLSAEEDIPWK
jgi:hypothetical protein